MKPKSVLHSTHDLKKNGYHILRKLRKIETRKGAKKAYSFPFNDTFFFVLSIQALFEIMNKEYPEELVFLERCDRFQSYLENVAKKRQKINRTVLASFLQAYTKFFSHIVSVPHLFKFSDDIIEIWNTKCLMAYVATWGKNS